MCVFHDFLIILNIIYKSIDIGLSVLIGFKSNPVTASPFFHIEYKVQIFTEKKNLREPCSTSESSFYGTVSIIKKNSKRNCFRTVHQSWLKSISIEVSTTANLKASLDLKVTRYFDPKYLRGKKQNSFKTKKFARKCVKTHAICQSSQYSGFFF